MVLRVVVGRSVVNLISVYAPQTGRGKEEKRNSHCFREDFV